MSKIQIEEIDQQEIEQQQSNQLGWLLLGSGFATALALLFSRNRRKVGWLLPLGLIVAGIVYLLQQRQTHIDKVQERILVELDGLDPIARAQILKNLAEREFNALKLLSTPE